jgi:hypothetical protein
LWTGQADRRDAHRVEGHRHQRRALVLAGGEQDVELAGIRFVRDRGSETEQLVGRVTHGGHDHDEVMACGALARDPSRDPLDPVRTGDRRAAVFLDDQGGGHAAHSTAGSCVLRTCGDVRSAPVCTGCTGNGA